jgi:carboxypeptidase PM20D1
MLKKLGLSIGAILAVGTAVIAYNTLTFHPEDIAEARDIKLAALPSFDVEAAATRLGQAIGFETVSHQDIAENKPEEWTKLQSWLQSSYPAAHAAMSREIVGKAALLYRWQGSDPKAQPIVVMAHQDVVPITPGTEKNWKYAPFSGVIAENAVWGRGAVDDKGSLIGLFEALEILAKQGFKPRRTIILVSGHDEEAGGSGAVAAAVEVGKGPKALFTIDEGSAVVMDAPLINAPAILIGVAEKGYGTVKITANAAGGHSSMPPKEIGTVNLAKAVIAINDNQFESRFEPPVGGMLGALAQKKGGIAKVMAANQWLFGGLMRWQFGKSPAGAAMLHTTIAPTMLQGSPKENVLPQSATALINYRIAPWQSSKDVMERAKSAVGRLPVDVSWSKDPREPSKVSSTNSQGWKLIRAAAEADLPGAAVAPYLVVAGTDSRSFTRVSDDVYRFQPLHFKAKETAMIHGTNEHMTIDNLRRMIGFYARLIATAAG